MIGEFAVENPSLLRTSGYGPGEMSKLVEDVRAGDLSLIYQKYESEILHPIRNILAGTAVA